MSERSDKVLLEDMLEAVDRILEYTSGYSPEAFGKDKKTIDAVLRNLQVLGEAAKQVSDVTKKPIQKLNGQKSFDLVMSSYMNILELTLKLFGELYRLI